MVDVFNKEKRSDIMSKVRSRNTKPEMTLRKALFKAGVRGYRLSVKLPGSPDIVFPRLRIAVFVDGCFWHGCPLCYTEPENNAEFWRRKIIENRERDERVNKALIEMGWEPIRFWEHSIEKDLLKCVLTIQEIIHSRLSTKKVI